MKIYTYDLTDSSNCSDEYYHKTQILSREMQDILNMELTVWVERFIDEKDVENTLQESTEYKIALILFAILHKWYWKQEKDIIVDFEKISYTDLMDTIRFMKQSGEFKEELYYFDQWMKYFISLGEKEWKSLWQAIDRVVSWIQKTGDRELKKYLLNVDAYREKIVPLRSTRKDYALLSRDSLCYYVNMIGAEILNSIYIKDFKQVSQKYVFLPGCMTRKGSDCKASPFHGGFICNHCSSECMISKISNDFSDEKNKIRIIYHESELNHQIVSSEQKIGVIGISCILNLIAGGFKAKRLGYIPQCVLLDYCGCSQHWSLDEERVVTSINVAMLKNKIDS